MPKFMPKRPFSNDDLDTGARCYQIYNSWADFFYRDDKAFIIEKGGIRET